jgi:hypothetical protein
MNNRNKRHYNTSKIMMKRCMKKMSSKSKMRRKGMRPLRMNQWSKKWMKSMMKKVRDCKVSKDPYNNPHQESQ